MSCYYRAKVAFLTKNFQIFHKLNLLINVVSIYKPDMCYFMPIHDVYHFLCHITICLQDKS